MNKLATQKLEIQTHENSWIEVSESIFRSWTGKRRLNGEKYIGPRYIYLTEKLIGDNQRVID